jgi:predicted HTH transcriptional regulator
VGLPNRLADKVIIAELKRFVLDESFDEQPFPKLSSEAIDFRVTSELFNHMRKLRPRDLETLNIVTNYQGHKVPTIGGVILFCPTREKYFPDSWIQAGRFAGKDKRHISDTVKIKSYPVIEVKIKEN